MRVVVRPTSPAKRSRASSIEPCSTSALISTARRVSFRHLGLGRLTCPLHRNGTRGTVAGSRVARYDGHSYGLRSDRPVFTVYRSGARPLALLTQLNEAGTMPEFGVCHCLSGC